MAQTLSTTLKMVLTSLLQNPIDGSSPTDDYSKRLSDVLSNGTADDQNNQNFHDIRSVAGAAETLDFSAGGLVNGLAAAATFSKIRLIVIINNETATGKTLTIGNATAPILIGAVAADRFVIKPGGYVVLFAPVDGYTVTQTTADGLKIDPGANTCSYEIFVSGQS